MLAITYIATCQKPHFCDTDFETFFKQTRIFYSSGSVWAGLVAPYVID